jgi:hypothetical protein
MLRAAMVGQETRLCSFGNAEELTNRRRLRGWLLRLSGPAPIDRKPASKQASKAE